MCGIVGYVGPRIATPLLVEGLKRLEYRGYDSAGIAVMNGKGVELAFGAEDLEAPVLLDRDTRRVVAAVLQAPQATHEERQRLARADVADDPAHT